MFEFPSLYALEKEAQSFLVGDLELRGLTVGHFVAQTIDDFARGAITLGVSVGLLHLSLDLDLMGHAVLVSSQINFGRGISDLKQFCCHIAGNTEDHRHYLELEAHRIVSQGTI